jgi:DNA repair photolyase
MFKSWDKILIKTTEGKEQEAIVPIIISASRATDLPAFYANWFINKVCNDGYSIWINNFNQNKVYVSYKNTRLIVFWSKNPKPIIEHLPKLDALGINYYFQFTLNDYQNENIEPNVPSVDERIETFKELSNKIGKEKVIWRFDPLILSDKLTVPKLLDKISNIGNQIYNYTDKLVISFADINSYKNVASNLLKESFNYVEFTEKEMISIAEGLRELNKNWNLSIGTCAEKVDLLSYGIVKNKCIDDDLIVKLFPKDKELMNFLGYSEDLFGNSSRPNMKDKGQRVACGCMVSKDIGYYNTCKHFCAYCYANSSKEAVNNKIKDLNLE